MTTQTLTAPTMDAYTATMIAEGVEEADEATTTDAWQYLHDTGLELFMYYRLGDDLYQAVSAGIDWAKLTELARTWAADLDDLDEGETEKLTNPRCTETLELPL